MDVPYSLFPFTNFPFSDIGNQCHDNQEQFRMSLAVICAVMAFTLQKGNFISST